MTDPTPPLHLTPVRAGFIPLVDCAVLAVARDKGFAAENGIDLQLFKEVSWANIRDRISVGHFDVAHMLAGMPIAANLGIGHIKVPTIAPMALGEGGNAITLGQALYEQMEQTDADLTDPLSSGQALKSVIQRRQKENQEPLSFGMVFPFSCHNYQLRHWMAASGIDPERDVRLVVTPPPDMVQSLKDRQIDGFCVGEPWNSLAVEDGVGRILMSCSKIWPSAPEKVIGVRRGWADSNPETLAALLRAFVKAAQWADDADNHEELATILSHPAYLGVAPQVIQTSLARDLRFYGNGAVTAACEQSLWLYAQMVRWGQTELNDVGHDIACQTYRPDLLSNALDQPLPPYSVINPPLLDGTPFNPCDINGYIKSLASKKDEYMCNV